MTDPLASHGRGGAGNIAPDSNAYIDGNITRQGPVGDQGDGSYSSGRGGAGNINSPRTKPTNPSSQPGDKDVVPETAMQDPRHSQANYQNYHVGRGGEGNIHREQHGEHKEGLKEKILHPFGGSGKKE